jgi:hypothetical protein
MSLWVIEHDSFQGGRHEDFAICARGTFKALNLDATTYFYRLVLGAELRAQQTLAGVKVNRLRAGETGLGLFDASETRFPGVRITLSKSEDRIIPNS